MPHISYSVEQLHQFRQSPLVRKPDGLPSLDQWMETAAERRKHQKDEHSNTTDGAPTTRPLFPTRHSARNTSEDFILGPPQTKFVSSGRNQTRNADGQEKGADRYNAATFGDNDNERPSPNPNRNRGLRDQDDDRLRDRSNLLGRRGNVRDSDGEGWSTVARRRGSQNEEGAERWRPGDRSRKDGDAVEELTRRTGMGRAGGKMGAWRDEQADAEGNRLGNRWRERENRDRENRDRGPDRDWTRGHKVQDRLDEEPEWMSEPIVKPVKEEKTQEDFERWKAEQRAKSGHADKDELTPLKESKQPEPARSMLDLTGFGMFGNKQPEANKAEAAPVEKLPQLKGLGKASKFGAFFQKEETPPSEPEPRRPSQHVPQAMPQQVAEPNPRQLPQQASSPAQNGQSSKEDAEGFARILQMLGGTKLSSPPPQQTTDGALPGRLAMFPISMPAEPEHRVSRPDSASLVSELLARHTANKSRGAQTAPAETDGVSQYFPGQGGEFPRGNGRDEIMTPRGAPLFSPPLASNGARQRPQTPTEQRDFLLKLIQADRDKLKHQEMFQQGAGAPLQQRPQDGISQRMTPSAPPGLHEGMYNRGSGEHDMQQLRKTQSRPQVPLMEFFDQPHDPAIMNVPMPGLMRRNTAEQAPQQRIPASNMGIPSQHAPNDPYRMNMPPTQQQDNRGAGMPPHPPPGFVRPPPGFQPPPPHLQSPQGHLPGMRNMPPNMFPPGMGAGPPVGMNAGLGGPPPLPGYFGPPPPGFSPSEFFMRGQGAGRFPDEIARGMQPGRGGPPPPGFM